VVWSLRTAGGRGRIARIPSGAMAAGKEIVRLRMKPPKMGAPGPRGRDEVPPRPGTSPNRLPSMKAQLWSGSRPLRLDGRRAGRRGEADSAAQFSAPGGTGCDRREAGFQRRRGLRGSWGKRCDLWHLSRECDTATGTREGSSCRRRGGGHHSKARGEEARGGGHPHCRGGDANKRAESIDARETWPSIQGGGARRQATMRGDWSVRGTWTPASPGGAAMFPTHQGAARGSSGRAGPTSKVSPGSEQPQPPTQVGRPRLREDGLVWGPRLHLGKFFSAWLSPPRTEGEEEASPYEGGGERRLPASRGQDRRGPGAPSKGAGAGGALVWPRGRFFRQLGGSPRFFFLTARLGQVGQARGGTLKPADGGALGRLGVRDLGANHWPRIVFGGRVQGRLLGFRAVPAFWPPAGGGIPSPKKRDPG